MSPNKILSKLLFFRWYGTDPPHHKTTCRNKLRSSSRFCCPGVQQSPASTAGCGRAGAAGSLSLCGTLRVRDRSVTWQPLFTRRGSERKTCATPVLPQLHQALGLINSSDGRGGAGRDAKGRSVRGAGGGRAPVPARGGSGPTPSTEPPDRAAPPRQGPALRGYRRTSPGLHSGGAGGPPSGRTVAAPTRGGRKADGAGAAAHSSRARARSPRRRDRPVSSSVVSAPPPRGPGPAQHRIAARSSACCCSCCSCSRRRILLPPPPRPAAAASSRPAPPVSRQRGGPAGHAGRSRTPPPGPPPSCVGVAQRGVSWGCRCGANEVLHILRFLSQFYL